MEAFPRPDQINGDQLAAELGVDPNDVSVTANELIIAADVDRTAAEQKIADHVPAAPPPDPQTEFDAAIADAAAKATTDEKVDAILAALGGSGLPAKAAARGK